MVTLYLNFDLTLFGPIILKNVLSVKIVKLLAQQKRYLKVMKHKIFDVLYFKPQSFKMHKFVYLDLMNTNPAIIVWFIHIK